jgi:hypothetical protein
MAEIDTGALLACICALFTLSYIGTAAVWRALDTLRSDVGSLRERLVRIETQCSIGAKDHE